MTLRARVLSGMLLIAVLLSVAAVVVTRTTRDNLVDQVDAQLAAGAPRALPPGIPVAPRRQEGSSRPERISAIYLGVMRDDGSLETIFTPNITDDPALPIFQAARLPAQGRLGTPFTVASTEEGVEYRALATADQLSGETIVVAMSLADVDRAVTRLVVVEVVATATVLALLAAVAWWVVRLGVRPIKRMTKTASAIAAGDLTQRVPPGYSAKTEAGELGTALNQMLTHIEAAFAERTASEDRLRRFIADASHELRTPVATIRGYAELYRTGGLRHEEELGDAIRRTEDEAVRMTTLIDDMLLLARLDQGRPLEQEPVDLSLLAADAASDARAVAPGRHIEAQVGEALVVIGDDHRLRQVVNNLVRNALVHTPDTASVEIRTTRSNGNAVLEVADTGPGMSEDTAARAFERFYRADVSRSRHRGGSGLGLSIVHATVTALGGRVELHSEAGSGTTARIELPLAHS